MEENKTFKAIAYIGVFVFVLALCWYLLSEPNVSDQRDRASDVRNELANTGAAQRDAEKHLDSAGQRIDNGIGLADEISRGIDEATERIADSTARNAECAELVADSERRIAESRAILQAVRNRAGQDGK